MPDCKSQLCVAEQLGSGYELVEEAIPLGPLLGRLGVIEPENLIGCCRQHPADAHQRLKIGLSVARDIVAITPWAEAGASCDLRTCEIELFGSFSQPLPQNLHANMMFLLSSTVSMSELCAILRNILFAMIARSRACNEKFCGLA